MLLEMENFKDKYEGIIEAKNELIDELTFEIYNLKEEKKWMIENF
jgi:hypothetical protein